MIADDPVEVPHMPRPSRMWTAIDEFTCELRAVDVAAGLTSGGALVRISDPFVWGDAPGHNRVGNGPESTSEAVRGRPGCVGVKTPCIG